MTTILRTFGLFDFDYKIPTLYDRIYHPLDDFVSITFKYTRNGIFLPPSARVKRWLNFFNLAPTQLAPLSFYSLICTYILYVEHLNTILFFNELNYFYTFSKHKDEESELF